MMIVEYAAIDGSILAATADYKPYWSGKPTAQRGLATERRTDTPDEMLAFIFKWWVYYFMVGATPAGRKISPLRALGSR